MSVPIAAKCFGIARIAGVGTVIVQRFVAALVASKAIRLLIRNILSRPKVGRVGVFAKSAIV